MVIVDPEYSRVDGWLPVDILELQKIDDIAALEGCSLSIVHGCWSAGFTVEVFGVQDKWYREYLHGEDGRGPTAGDRPGTHESDDLTNCQGDPPLIFAGRWRKVSTAGAVDLSAVFQVGGSGSLVVSIAKGTVTRWKTEAGRSDNSLRVNAVDSAGRNPDASHLCEVELEANSGRQVRRECRPEAPQLPSTNLDLDLGDVRADIASLRSELNQKPSAEVVREREGVVRREHQGVSAPCRRGAGQESQKRPSMVSRGVFPEALKARARKQARCQEGS